MKRNPRAKTATLAAGLVAGALLITGCSMNDDSNPVASNYTADLSASVHVSISASSDRVSPSDPTTLEVVIENRGVVPVALQLGSGSCWLGAVVQVGSQEFSCVDRRVCTMDAPTVWLKSGESRAESWKWDGSIWRDGTIEPLPAGVYTVAGAASKWASRNAIEIEVAE